MNTVVRKRRIRVGLVSPYRPRVDGVARYIVELCRALRVVAPHIAVSVWPIDHDGRHDWPAEVVGAIDAADPSAYRRAAQSIRKVGADVVLVQYSPAITGGPCGRYVLGLCDDLHRAGVPYLVILHDVRFSPRPDHADAVAALCRSADGVVVVSDAAQRALAGSGAVPTDRIAVVPTGVPPDLMTANGPVSPTFEEALLSVNGLTILTTIGQLRPAKGIDVGIDAVARLAHHRTGLRYVVLAPRPPDGVAPYDDWLRHELHEQAARLGVADRFRLIDAEPTKADLSALLHSTSVYLAPDRDGGRTESLALTYAVAVGRPVVATAHPYAQEIVSPPAGRLIRPGDPVALAAATAELLGQRPLHGSPSIPTTDEAADQIAGLIHLTLSRRRRAAAAPTRPRRVPAGRNR